MKEQDKITIETLNRAVNAGKVSFEELASAMKDVVDVLNKIDWGEINKLVVDENRKRQEPGRPETR